MGLLVVVGLAVLALIAQLGPHPQEVTAISFLDLPPAIRTAWTLAGAPAKDVECYKVVWELNKPRLTNAELRRYAKASHKGRGDITLVELHTPDKTYVVLVIAPRLLTAKLDQGLSTLGVKLDDNPPMYAFAS